MRILKPELREDAELDLNGRIASAVRQALKDNIHPFKNCLNCKHFEEKSEMCNSYHAKPPARVIAYGCPEHDDMYSVPF